MKYRSYKSKRSKRSKRYGGRRRLQSKSTKRPASDMLPRIAKYARTAYDVGRFAHKSYTKIKEWKRKTTKPNFNNGYSITNMKAVNKAKRRRTPRLKSGSQLQLALMSRMSLNYKRINEIEIGRGRLLLPNITFVPDLQLIGQFLPLHLFSLDRDPRTETANTQVIQNQLRYERNTATGFQQYFFDTRLYTKSVIEGESANSDAYPLSSNIASSWTDGSDALTSDGRKLYQKRVKAEFVMYGQTNQDTLYRIDVIRMSEKFATYFSQDPVTNLVIPADPNIITEWNAFWHSLVAPYTQNPLHKPERTKSNIYMLKSYYYKIPEQSADFDRIPSVKTSITVPMNRVLDYRWKRGTNGSTTTEFDPEDANLMGLQTADTFNARQYDRGFVHPKYRTFLMIRATNNDQRDLAADASTITVTRGQDPTYDINLRSEYLVDV